MAEDIIIGKRIQAIDSLGRWENAKVKEIDNTIGEYFVTFPGWGSEWDRWVTKGELRIPVRPLREQQRSKLVSYCTFKSNIVGLQYKVKLTVFVGACTFRR